jgi:hypothetical protein
MKKETVVATVPADAKAGRPELKAQIAIDAPETIEEAVKAFGGDAVLSNAMKSWVIALQNTMRLGLKKGESQAQLQARLAGAKMGMAVGRSKVDPMQALMAQYASGTPEQKAAIKKQLADLLK